MGTLQTVYNWDPWWDRCLKTLCPFHNYTQTVEFFNISCAVAVSQSILSHLLLKQPNGCHCHFSPHLLSFLIFFHLFSAMGLWLLLTRVIKKKLKKNWLNFRLQNELFYNILIRGIITKQRRNIQVHSERKKKRQSYRKRTLLDGLKTQKLKQAIYLPAFTL